MRMSGAAHQEGAQGGCGGMDDTHRRLAGQGAGGGGGGEEEEADACILLFPCLASW